jgi:putative transposase
MARFARVVVPCCPHHVTQRGNYQQEVFFCDADYRTYLTGLREHAFRFHVQVLAWCLMPNHVHLVTVPQDTESLARVLGRTQAEYARWLHVRQRKVGHLWQNRFHSCPMEEGHLWDAIRYVELNPVRGGLARKAADWRWSSAAAHLEDVDEWGLTDLRWWHGQGRGAHWAEILEAGFRDTALAERLREATQTGRPFGSVTFAQTLERETGRPLLPQKRGVKPKAAVLTGQMELPNLGSA